MVFKVTVYSGDTIFGTEFVAIKQGIDAVIGFRYKLRMIDNPILGPLSIYGDNTSVVHNTSRLVSVLRKKSNSVCSHSVHESVAMGSPSLDIHPAKKILQI